MTPMDVPPPLARGAVDRAALERDEPGLLERLHADPRTRVVPVHGDRVLRTDDGRLQAVPVADIPASALTAFLGRTADGTALLLATDPSGDALPAGQDSQWSPLRVAGADLAPDDAARAVQAVSLARWLRDAPYCSACGSRTELTQAGWSRRCLGCGRQHFPRTDPAVIVAVQSEDGSRLLLGRNAAWGDRPVFSTFAGFVESGESVEVTVHREIEEEAGVRLTELAYRGSQPWPYPRSLMLGFLARAVDDAAARPDGTEIIDVRWFTRDDVARALRGEGDVRLPGAASIAHTLITGWARS